MNISDIKKLDPGTILSVVTGNVDEVYKQKTGSSKHGQWTVQGVKLSEGREFIFVDFWNKPDLSGYKGHQIKITDDVEVKENNWTDKQGNAHTGIKLSAGKKSVITSPGFGDEGTPPPTTPQPTSGSAPMATSPRSEPNEIFVKKSLNRYANLYLMVEDAVDYIAKNKPFEGESGYQSAVATLFIQAVRDGLQDKVACGSYNKAHQEEAPPAPVAPPPPPPSPPPQPAPRTPANPQYGDHRDSGMAFHPNDGIDDDVPF